MLLVAGNETTTNLIGNAVLCLAESPGTMDRLLREPALLPQTIEEVLRFRSPVQSMYRFTVAETTLGDQLMPAGAPIVAWIGSANRDERQFQRAAEFDIDRGQNRHLAFGHGILLPRRAAGPARSRDRAGVPPVPFARAFPGSGSAPGTNGKHHRLWSEGTSGVLAASLTTTAGVSSGL